MAIFIDGSHLLCRLVFMNGDKVKENPEFISHLVLTSVLYNASRFGASRENPVIMSLDSTSWRKEFFEKEKEKFADLRNVSYKGNREKSKDIPWDEIYGIYHSVLEGLKENSDFHVIKVNRAEADDIIGVGAKYYKAKGEVVWIISGDKDFLQLQDEGRVNIYDPIKNIFRPQIDVERFKKIHYLIGDKCDNIPAVKARLGEKTAEKMLHELDILLQTNPTLKARYELNEKLISFDKIPEDVYNDITLALEEPHFNYNGMKLLKVFKTYKLMQLAENINRFNLAPGPVKTKLNQHFITQKKIEAINNNTLEEFFS